MDARFDVAMDKQVFLALASLILAGGDKKPGGRAAPGDAGTNERDRGPAPPQQGDSQADPETAGDRVADQVEAVTPDTQQR